VRVTYDADEQVDDPFLATGQPARRSRGGRRAVIAVLGFFILLVVLAILVLPFLTVGRDGRAAQADLTAALNAMADGDVSTAQARVTSARERVDSATAAAEGTRADVLGSFPVAGGAVDDVRRITVALDAAVTIAELGLSVYPAVLGDDATLVQGGAVDLSALASVTGVTDEVRGHLARAHAALDDVTGSTPLVGGMLADARDRALDQIVPLETSIERYQPVLEVLPSLLGTEGPRTYLVAVMNPSELRMSGGATLSLAPMTFDQGQLTFGAAGNTFDFTNSNEDISWEPVPGNPWHTSAADQLPLVNATFSPNWTTSAEELLRAWEATSGDRVDTLIAIDLPAIASLFSITGPVEVPKYGVLDENNFVKTLAGSYDKYSDDEERRELNAAIIPLLRTKLFEGGKFAQKAQALLAAADERRFVVYFRDAAVQEAMVELGVRGDLSATTQDYLGVFTQNTNASKVDFWQQKSLVSEVTVNADGSADVTLTVTLHNDTPRYTRPSTDPQRGYFTRWSIPFVAAYLPVGAEHAAATLDGAPIDVTKLGERERGLVAVQPTLEPGSTHVLTHTYRVPQAALVEGDSLAYAVDIDPQATVSPADLRLTVRMPAGYAVEELPADWTQAGDVYTYAAKLGAARHLVLNAARP